MDIATKRHRTTTTKVGEEAARNLVAFLGYAEYSFLMPFRNPSLSKIRGKALSTDWRRTGPR